ncbi:hypothetical protein BOTBODRAFT_31150, partial [Botryobasidium botryosum FD-172 SS1]
MGGRQHLDVNQGCGLLIGVLARCARLRRDAAGGRGFGIQLAGTSASFCTRYISTVNLPRSCFQVILA